ncbi:MAG: hypothetical protein WAU72_02020 [Acidimicrobiia bacterium]|jgi:hypothetical protein
MKIVAAFSKRYEPEYLVDELRENLAWCDDIIVRNPSLDWIPVGADYYINSLEELPELLESIK